MTYSDLITLDELTQCHYEMKLNLENKFKSSGYQTKALFLACHKGAVSDLYHLDLMATKAKAKFNVDLLPFMKNITICVNDPDSTAEINP